MIGNDRSVCMHRPVPAGVTRSRPRSCSNQWSRLHHPGSGQRITHNISPAAFGLHGVPVPARSRFLWNAKLAALNIDALTRDVTTATRDGSPVLIKPV